MYISKNNTTVMIIFWMAAFHAHVSTVLSDYIDLSQVHTYMVTVTIQGYFTFCRQQKNVVNK